MGVRGVGYGVEGGWGGITMWCMRAWCICAVFCELGGVEWLQ